MRALVALVVLLMVAACGSESGSGDPDPTPSSGSAAAEDAVRELLTALESGSCPDVKAIVLTPASVDCEVIGTLEGSFADEGVDLADVTYEAKDIAADSGSVTTDWGNGEPADSWQVERVDGVWKVVFDSVE